MINHQKLFNLFISLVFLAFIFVVVSGFNKVMETSKRTAIHPEYVVSEEYLIESLWGNELL